MFLNGEIQILLPQSSKHWAKGTSQGFFITTCHFRFVTFRAHLIKSVGEGITRAEVLPNRNKCIVHFLDLNANRTLDYLESAWNAGAIGHNHFYLCNLQESDRLASLNFTDIFDFQRIFLITTSKVCLVFRQYIDIIFPTNILLLAKH